MFKILKQWILIPDKRNKYYVMKWSTRRGPLATFAECTKNAAARFITGARKYDHISPVLRDLHWLPLRQRIIFKIATLMHQCMNGLAPSYLATDCIAISSMSGRRQLRSAASGQLYNPRTKTMTFGPRSFKVSGPTIWNDLPNISVILQVYYFA